MKQQLQRNRDGAITFRPILDGVDVTVTNPKVTVQRPGGSALPVPVVDADATVLPDGRISYTVAAANTATPDQDYVVDWQFSYDGATYYRRDLFDVVLIPLYPVVSDDDVRRFLGGLAQFFYPNDTGSRVEDIANAWDALVEEIERRGRRPNLVIEAGQLRRAHLLKTVALIFEGQSQEPNDIWWARRKEKDAELERLLDSLPFRYDADDGGTIGQDEHEQGWGSATLIR